MRVLDLRLVPAAVGAWLVAIVLVGLPIAAAVWTGGAAVVLGALALLLQHRLGTFAGQVVLVFGVVACVAAGVLGQQTLMGVGMLRQLVAQGASVTVVGQVVTEPKAIRGGFGAQQYMLRVDVHEVRGRVAGAVTATTAHGELVVLGGPELCGPGYGSTVGLHGTLRGVDPGSRTVGMLLVGAATGADPPVLVVAEPGAVQRGVNTIRADFADIARTLPDQARGLVPGVAVGDTSMLSDELDNAMVITSLTHITAVSGSHFAIIGVAVLGLCAVLRLPRAARVVVTAVFMTGFVLLVHPEPSVLRAAVMCAVSLVALALGRQSQAVAALCATVIILLALDPFLARSYGFALSVLATAGIVLGTAPLTKRLSKVLPGWLALALAVPIAAQLACAPVIVLLDPSVSLYSVPANLLAAPALVPATILGVVGALCAPWWPALSGLCAQVAGWATWWIAEVATSFAALPGAKAPWVAGAPGAVLLAVVTGAGLLGSALWPRTNWALRSALYTAGLGRAPSTPRPVPGWRRLLSAAGSDGAESRTGAFHAAWRPLRVAFTAVTITVLVLLVIVTLRPPWLGNLLGGIPAGPRGWPPDWEIAQCNVGQGDALLVQTAPGHALMIDVGPAGPAAATCLAELSITTVDLLVLSHFHADHVGGLPAVLEAVTVTKVLISPEREPVTQSAAVLGELDSAGVPWQPADTSMAGAIGDVTWRVLAARAENGSGTGTERAPDIPPSTADTVDLADDPGANESSIALQVQTAHLSLVALGDLETEGQARVRRALDDLGLGTVDVVKMAHHGSRTQDARLAALLHPQAALVSSGVGNPYGHPSKSALDLYRSQGASILRTDTCGTVGLLVRDGQPLVLGACP